MVGPTRTLDFGDGLLKAHIGFDWPMVSGPTLAQQCTTERNTELFILVSTQPTIVLIAAISKFCIHSEYFTKRSLTKWEFLLR